MSKAALGAIKFFEAIAGTGFRGKAVSSFLSGVVKLVKPRAKVIDDNLKLAYPDSPAQWRKDIRSSVYENLAWTVTELLVLKKKPSLASSWVKKVHGLEIADDLLARKKGALFLSGHFGNWELLASWYAQYARAHGHSLSIISQEQADPDITRYIEDMRRSFGVDFIPKETSVMKFAHLLKNGAHIALLNDIAGVGECMVPFMGHDATNMPGPAVMAMLAGVPIVPVAIYRNAPFEHEAEFFEPVKMPDKGLSHEERMKAIVFECNLAIEKFIRKRPELWFWLHKRWRP